MKEAVTKVIERLKQEDSHGDFQTLLERYNNCTAAEGCYFEGDLSFLYVSSIKLAIRKKSGKLFNDPYIYIYIYIYIYMEEKIYTTSFSHDKFISVGPSEWKTHSDCHLINETKIIKIIIR